MGKVPKPETERNQKLIEDYLKCQITEVEGGDDIVEWDYSIAELGLKYARHEDGKVIPLSAVRIHQILSKNGVDKNRVPEKKSKK